MSPTTSASLTTSPTATPRTGESRPTSQPLPWLIGGLGAAAVVAAGGWLLVLAPQAQAASDLQDQTAQAESTEVQVTARVSQLQQQFSDLAQYQAQLAALEVAMPADPALPELVRAVRDAAATSGVQLTGLVPSAPVVAAGAATDQSAPAADGTDAAGTGTGTEAPAASAAPDGLVQVPVSITASGSYAALQQFLAALQQQQRLVLITSAGLTPSTTGSAPAGTSELVLTVTGAVFAFGDSPAAAGAAVTGADGPVAGAASAPATTDAAPIS